jgi:undecaprenyl-phosphate 4-deoxy-4-formamido-L-arabinose transferase
LIEEFRSHDVRFEIILIDDASHDDSWRCVEELSTQYSEVWGFSMTRNFGQHAASLAGIRAAGYARTITMDDDLQHVPDQIWLMDEALTPAVDVVYGQAIEEEHGVWRNLTSRMIKASLGAAAGADFASKASAFRLIRTSTRDAFADSMDPYVSIDVLLSWTTTRVVSIPVRMDQRRHGASNYTLRRLARHAVNMLTGFSVLPLRIVTFTGFAFAIFGVLILAFVLVRFVAAGGSLPGFPFLASIIAIFSGAQLFALGVLGEYLGRIHFRSMQRPPYLIRTSTGHTPPNRAHTGGPDADRSASN